MATPPSNPASSLQPPDANNRPTPPDWRLIVAESKTSADMEKHLPALESLIKRLEEENQKAVARNLVLESVYREQRRLLDEKPDEDILKVKSERDGVFDALRKVGEEYVKVKEELERGEKKCKMRVAELEKRRWNSEAEIKKMETDLQAERRAAETEIVRMRGLVEAMAIQKRKIEVELRDRVLKLEEEVFDLGEEQEIRSPGVTAMVTPPITPMVALVEKPQTTVYVGKIPSLVEDDFMLSLLQICGPVKSWKRPQDPSNGTPKAFGFCEFESTEGVLRSLRLLSRVEIDGQELGLNVSEATRDYLKRHSTPKDVVERESNNDEVTKLEKGEGDDNESGSKENDMLNFGLASDEAHEADCEAKEKIATAIEKRWRSRPLTPPPPLPLPQKNDVIATLNSEGPARSGENDSDVDVRKDDKHDDEVTSEAKTITVAGMESPERGRRYDGRGRERDRDRFMKRETKHELKRIEREREQERAKRERERDQRIQISKRLYKERVKEWETREKEREDQRKHENQREKEKEWDRRRLIKDQEDESDDDSQRRRQRRRSGIEGKRRKRQSEREKDLADRLKEDEEIAEANKRAEGEKEEDKKQMGRAVLQRSSAPIANGKEKVTSHETDSSGAVEHFSNDDTTMTLDSASDIRISKNAPTKKLGFGISGLEKDNELHKDKKTSPLVHIDYSAEELQRTDPGLTPPSTPLAADAAKHTTMASKDERSETENNNVMDAKKLTDMIPKTKEELFSYDINWVVYDKHGLQERMRPCIVKKIIEFLGQEETTLVDYIMSSIQDHVNASQMLDQLLTILDEESEMFVLKMWRVLICEIKRVEIGSNETLKLEEW